MRNHYEPVYADWVTIEKPYQPPGLETAYFDPNTIHRKSGQATLWQLTDITWYSTTRFLSSKTNKEFDYELSRVCVLQVIVFSRQVGTGRPTAGYIEHGDWQPIEGTSVNQALWKAACETH